MSACAGVGGHCCHLGRHGVCGFLRDDGVQAERQFSCAIRERQGSWGRAHWDPEYLRVVRPILDELKLPDCGDWPRPGERCNQCQVVG